MDRSSFTLYRLNIESHTLEELGEVKDGEGRVAWATPGQLVCFSRTVNDLTNIWEYNLSDRRLTQKTTGPGPDHSAMTDPEGKGTYFINGKESGALSVYRAHTKQSTNIVNENATQPVVSGVGSRVAYVLLLGSGRQELWASDVDGINASRLTSGKGLETLGWSHDATQLVFPEVSEGAKIFTIRLDGTGIRQIAWSGAFIGWAVWSPDDRDIYLSGYKKDPANVKIWKVRADSLSVETFSEACGDRLRQ